jgi:oligoribonuclease NrnB/cAMP/cGMP phosphodiesterase (DHH superfamily)
MKTICIYHANCFDGFAAAWVVRKKLRDAGGQELNIEYIPAHYGDMKLMNSIQQDCYENANINDDYIILDFSFPRDLMIQIYNKARSILVLDHHKTAEENCKGLDFCQFNMNESGASLAWKYFFPEREVPLMIQYIADRDLWKFELPDSKYVNAYIQSFPMTFNDYDYIHDTLSNYSLLEVINIGKGIERYKNSMVEAMCKNATLQLIGDYWVPVINCSLLFSEVGHYMCQQEYEYIDHRNNTTYMNKPPFAASYFIRADGKRQYSLRSIGDFDVSEVAKKYGGGGHKNAAGFEIG